MFHCDAFHERDDLRELVCINRKRRCDDFLDFVFDSAILGSVQYISRGIPEDIIKVRFQADITHISLAGFIVRVIRRRRRRDVFIRLQVISFRYRRQIILLVLRRVDIHIHLDKLVCFGDDTHDEPVFNDFYFWTTIHGLFRHFFHIVSDYM